MTGDKLDRRGEYVFVTYRQKTVVAFVALVSENGKSAILMFDAMLGGHVGAMAILWNDERGVYESLIENDPLVVTPYPS